MLSRKYRNVVKKVQKCCQENTEMLSILRIFLTKCERFEEAK